MKLINFFSRFTIICNIAFIFFAFFNIWETKNKTMAPTDAVIPFPYLTNLIITLGFCAIVINIIMCIVYALTIMVGRARILPKWMVATNVVMLIFEFYFFFFYK